MGLFFFRRKKVLTTPLISCLCVTRNRVPLLRRSVRCFQRQTYAERELLILCEDDDAATCSYVETELRGDSRIRFITVDAKQNLRLGALRNRIVAEARGELVCQWDDDDWSRSDRIARQKAHLDYTGKPACVLGRWIIFHVAKQQAYWSQWRTWEGSLLAQKAVLTPFPTLTRGEDTPMVDGLRARRVLTLLNDPELYVYTYHGRNTWDDQHFNMLLKNKKRVPPALEQQIICNLAEDGKVAPSVETPLRRAA